MKNSLNFLETIDLLGSPISYRINNKNKFKKAFGGILTIIMLLIVILLSSFFIGPFLKRLDPRVIYQNMKTTNPKPWDLNANNFFLALKFEFPNISYNDLMKYIKFEFAYVDQITLQDGSTQESTKILNITKSKIEDLPKESSVFYEYDLNNSLKINYEDGMLLRGVETSEELKYIRLRIFLYNLTDDYLENLNKFLNDNFGKFKLFYTDCSLDLINYIDPLEESISFFTDTLDININKRTTMEFSVNNVTTDYGFFMEKNNYENVGIINYSTNTDTSLRNYESLIFYEVEVILSKYSPIYLRSYMKIPELLANIGGILNFIVVFFGYFSNYLSIYFLNLNLMNEIFEFDKYILDDSNKAVKIRLDRDFNNHKTIKNEVREQDEKWSKNRKQNIELSNSNIKKSFHKIEDKQIFENNFQNKNLSEINSQRSDVPFSLRKLINENSFLEKRGLFKEGNPIPNNKNGGSTTSCESKSNKSAEIPKSDIKCVKFNLKNNLSNFYNSNPHVTFQEASKNYHKEFKKTNQKNLKDFSRLYENFKNRKKIKKVQKIFFTYSDTIALILPYCFKKSYYYSRKNELYKKALKHLHNYIDYTKVVKKTMEVDLLKFLLLDNDQITMYNLIKRPYITIDKKTSETPRSNLSNFSEVFGYYSNSCPKSSFDMRFLPQESKELFKEFYYSFLNKEDKNDIDLKILNSLHPYEKIKKNLSNK